MHRTVELHQDGRMARRATRRRSRVPRRLRLRRYFRWRAVADRVLAAVLLVLLAPLILALMLLVRLTSRGPAIYRQVRVGRGGKHFVMLKLRTMRVDAEKDTGAVWSVPGDKRVTPVGRVLRRLHLDELPQLWNILRGEMAFVGPRPERPEICRILAAEIPQYDRRHVVRPGLTGLAQINLPPDNGLVSVRRKHLLDLHYIESASLWMDTRIVMATALKVLGMRNLAPRLTGLDRRLLAQAAFPDRGKERETVRGLQVTVAPAETG